ncbi:MAG: ThiF family adenylyltransferase [Meiothermus sp.]|nr:ThiF family adenylyltransferase [Meiothermus sp.]
MDKTAFAEVLRERLDAVSVTEGGDAGGLAASGFASLVRQRLELRVILREDFPAVLPVILLKTRLTKRIPHVNNVGFVCFDRSSGLIIDRHDPAGVVRQALGRALEILEAGLAGRNHQDFIAEFKPTWLDIAPAGSAANVYSLVEPQGEVRMIQAAYGQRGEEGTVELTGFLENPNNLQRWGQAVFGVEPQLRQAVFVPLNAPVIFRPPPPGREWASQQVREFLEENLSRESWLTLRSLLKPDPHLPVLISVPRGTDSQAHVAIEPRGVQGKHPLVGKQESQPPVFYTVTRLDRGYLLPRGGAESDLGSRHALVVGCGSLGARVAEMLGAAGIGTLTLVDPDVLTSDNLYRHLLGAFFIGLPKVVALRADLQFRFPHLQVNPVHAPILDALRRGLVALETFDLVVAATGEPTVELELNARLRSLTKAPPTLFTWVEALGLGGHSLLVVPDQPGCLECLVCPSTHPETPLYNRASFAAPRQPKDLGRDLDGCGGVFTPFSALDASRTAEMATRMALRFLEGRLALSQLESWRGDPERFADAGFAVGERSHVAAEHPILQGRVFARSDCPTCGERK